MPGERDVGNAGRNGVKREVQQANPSCGHRLTITAANARSDAARAGYRLRTKSVVPAAAVVLVNSARNEMGPGVRPPVVSGSAFHAAPCWRGGIAITPRR